MTGEWPHYLPLQQSQRPARGGSELALARLTIERGIADAEFTAVVQVQRPLGNPPRRVTSG
jgi:hypothetical protein